MARLRLLAFFRCMVTWYHSESQIPLSETRLMKMLVHWLSRSPIFGPKDKIVEGLTEAWCIAKIHRLIGLLDPPIDDPTYEEEFWMAANLLTTTYEHPDTKLETQLITVGTLRQELEKLPGPRVSPDLVEFVQYLLVVDHTKRPTALEALEHPYLRLEDFQQEQAPRVVV
jgi:serine/threonine protein kinase